MGQVLFYQLTQILPRAMAQGWRVMVRGTDPARLQQLDLRLWQEPPEGFLPHGLQGGTQDAEQPILLGQGAIANAARALVLIDGASATADEARQLERVWVVFDGNDTEALTHARQQWRDTAAWGLAAQYFDEGSGRWERKAERAAPSA
jgi:DNA polymerase III subunit chi